jgi:hypothetical protein
MAVKMHFGGSVRSSELTDLPGTVRALQRNLEACGNFSAPSRCRVTGYECGVELWMLVKTVANVSVDFWATNGPTLGPRSILSHWR